MPQSAPALDRYLAENPDRQISAHYGTNQSDKTNLQAMIEREFEGPLDLIIDDASHLYGLSRATFGASFPLSEPWQPLRIRGLVVGSCTGI